VKYLPVLLGQARHIGRDDPCFGAGFLQGSVGQRSDDLGGVAGGTRRCEIGRIIAVTGNDVIDGIGLTAAIETAIRMAEQDRASHMLRDTHQRFPLNRRIDAGSIVAVMRWRFLIS
jgi:hypothetical protein